nr:T9SS type A sorting domain-containing protein [Bacteroidota bacterium]
MDQRLMESEISHIRRTKELLFSKPVEKGAVKKTNNCIEIVNLYPNPASHSFTVEFSACEKGLARIELFSSSGNCVFSKMMVVDTGTNIFNFQNTTNLNQKLLKPGMYILRISDGEQSGSQRIVIR